jgi:hypothetical protein
MMSRFNNRIFAVLGVVALIGLVVLIIKAINKKTETKLYSEGALEDEKLDKMEEAVANYYKKGEWKEVKPN